MDERLILMGVIGKPHGVRGLLRVNTFTEAPDALSGYPLEDRAGRKFSLEWVNDGIAQFSEILASGAKKITDRNEAEKLTNTELFAPRSALPAPDEEEFYLTDLIGLQAQNASGKSLGTIAAVHDYGAGPSLEITPGSLIVPFTRAAVPVVDLAAGHVVVIPLPEIIVTGEEP
jgi:16S rRNA processing protein RimM